MAKYKNIRIKKKGGGTRLQRVQVLASGKYKFVKNTGTAKTSKRKSTKRKSTKNKKTRGKRMAKSKKKKGNGFSITGLIRGGMYGGTLAAPSLIFYSQRIKAGVPATEAVGETLLGLAGMHHDTGKFEFKRLQQRLGPFLVWSVIDFGLSKTGIWKRMGQLLKF